MNNPQVVALELTVDALLLRITAWSCSNLLDRRRGCEVDVNCSFFAFPITCIGRQLISRQLISGQEIVEERVVSLRVQNWAFDNS
jgi:hypothetical protein